MGSSTPSSWEATATLAQQAVLSSIPSKYRLPDPPPLSSLQDVRHIPLECGLLTPAQLAITDLTTVELVRRLANRELSSVEVTEAFCGRAAVAHQLVNCLTAFYYEEAMQVAREYDAVLERTGEVVGPLHGLPIAIKDIFSHNGKPGTMGLVAWHDKDWGVDASIVTLLKKAGVVHFASTAMPQTGMMLQTVSPLWGRTLNPFNRSFSAGGSSGGDGSLIALHGSPFCPSTDIGGSIRAPSAFNGLYGIRPTADRIPKSGLLTAAPGNTSIKVSCGPNCHSVGDLKLVTRLLLAHQKYIGYEPTAVPIPWREVTLDKRLSFALMKTDGVVTPHPPVLRALEETAQKLRAAGHEVLEIDPPIDFWQAALVTWKLYFQTGAKEVLGLISSTGEPVNPAFAFYLKTFNIQELSVPELFQTNLAQATIKRAFASFWASTASLTTTGRPMDALICPPAPCASFPHDFPLWWGYTSIWSLLDYPSTILPVRDFKIDAVRDIKIEGYKPVESNVFDAMNAEIYDAKLWANMPVTVQIVRRQYEDEELIAVTEVLDTVANGV